MTIATITLQKNILRMLGQNPDNTVMQGRALEWANSTLDDIQTYMPDAEIFQTGDMEITFQDGQATYALPAEFFYLNQVRIDSEGLILQAFPKEEFDRRHPDPTNEEEDVPSDYTIEFDRVSGRHIIRVAPIPDVSTYMGHATMRRWHPSLTDSQNIQYDRLKNTLQRGAVYNGSLEIYADQEWAQYRSELKSHWLESAQGLQQVFAIGKARPKQIPTILKKSEY